MEDTDMKQVNPSNVQAQEAKKMVNQLKKIPVSSKHNLLIQILRLMKNNKIQIYLKIKHLEHHKMIIIELPSMMMSRMTQYICRCLFTNSTDGSRLRCVF